LPQDFAVPQNGIAFEPGDTNVIYVGTFGGGLAKSTNRGGTWTFMNSGLQTGYMSGGIYPWPNTPNILYSLAGSGPRAYKSTDGGSNWQISSNGLPAVFWVTGAFNPTNNNEFYVGGAQGVYKTVDGGGSWAPANSGFEELWAGGIVIDPTNPAVVYAATEGGGVFKSTNSGTSWQQVNSGLTDLIAKRLAMHPTDAQRLYLGTQTGVYRSINGGASWTDVWPGASGNVPDTVQVRAIVATQTAVFIGTRKHGVFFSNEGTFKWFELNEDLEEPFINKLAFDDPSNPRALIAGTGRGMYEKTLLGSSCPIALTGDVASPLSGSITSIDIIFMVNFIFRSGPAPSPCPAAGDINCDDKWTAADIIYLVNHVFKSGPAPCDACIGSTLTSSCL